MSDALADLAAAFAAYNAGTGPCSCGKRRGHVGWIAWALRHIPRS